MVHYIADLIGRGLRDIQARYPDWFTGIRQNGVVMGLEFDHPEGARALPYAILSRSSRRCEPLRPRGLLTPLLKTVNSVQGLVAGQAVSIPSFLSGRTK